MYKRQVLIDAFNGYSETALVRSSKDLQLAENMPPMVENLDTTEQMQRAVISWAEACICRLRGQQEHREDTTVFAAKQYISENYTSPLRLDDVAAYVGLSTPYFCMKFRQCTGCLLYTSRCV